MKCKKIIIDLKDSRGYEPTKPWYEDTYSAFGREVQANYQLAKLVEGKK